MGIIENYVAREWTKWFFLSVFFLHALLGLQLLSENFEILAFDETESLLKWLLLELLGFVPWILPISCFASTLLTLSFLTARGEIAGILSCSISWFRSFKLVILLGFVLSVTSWILMIKIEDWRHVWSVGNQDEPGASYLKMKIGNERLWHFERFDPVNRRGSRVHLYAYDSFGNDSFRIRARKAEWKKEGYWAFQEGQFLGFLSERGLPVYDPDKKKILWEEGLTRVKTSKLEKDSPGFSKRFEFLNLDPGENDPSLHLLLAKRPESLSFGQLSEIFWNSHHLNPALVHPYKHRFFQLCWNSLSCFLAIFCGLVIGGTNKSQKLGYLAATCITGALIFYGLRTLGDALGENGLVHAALSGCLPYLGVWGAAMLLTQR